jgi:hypothetical protein
MHGDGLPWSLSFSLFALSARWKTRLSDATDGQTPFTEYWNRRNPNGETASAYQFQIN